MATSQMPSEVEDIPQPRENSVSQPADTAVEDGECLETDENPKLNDENQLAVLDAIQQLGAEIASMKHDLGIWLSSKHFLRNGTYRMILNLKQLMNLFTAILKWTVYKLLLNS